LHRDAQLRMREEKGGVRLRMVDASDNSGVECA